MCFGENDFEPGKNGEGVNHTATPSLLQSDICQVLSKSMSLPGTLYFVSIVYRATTSTLYKAKE